MRIMRKTVPSAMAAALLLTAACSTSTTSLAASSHESCETTTSVGSISGVIRNGLCAFRGIPYAAPPTAERRFRPPQPVAPWKGTLQATNDKAVCPQARDALGEDYPDDRPAYTDEDCLYLNVWTPRPDHRKRPVIVFVHGGAARFGTANEPRYDGTHLATRGDAVVISLNYRLGVLGWTELGDLDPAYRGSGNNGLRDQIAALTWVRDHVADFGGDPANVTAVGESAGAFSLSALLATDHPERLFRRVVLQSGSGALVQSAAYKRRMAAHLPVKSVGELQRMSTARLLETQEKTVETASPGVLGALAFGPYVDGTLVRGPVTDRVAAGNARAIDIMLGTTQDEMNFFGQLGPDAMQAIAGQYEDVFFPRELAARRDHMVSVYRRGRSPVDASLAMFTDQGMRVPALRLAEAQSRWRPTYVYEFGWRPPSGYGAIHTIELPFMFGTFRFNGIIGGAEGFAADRTRLTTLSTQMLDAWTTFARTGTPNTRTPNQRQADPRPNPGNPRRNEEPPSAAAANADRTDEAAAPRPFWPPYRAPQRATMMWNTSPTIAHDPRGNERALWNGYPFAPFNLP